VASGDNINEVYDVVTEPFQYAITSLSSSSSSSSDCVDFTIVIIVAVVPTVILLTVIAVLVGIIIKLKRHTYKLDDPASTKKYVYKETTLLQSSVAYGLTVMQNGKSDERNYEELPSNTEKANEPMYTSIVN
jgi:heme/copper-type cytochrome/quinol oxidase subunit 2